MSKNIIWVVLCGFLTLLLVISGVKHSKNNRYENNASDHEFFMMNVRCIPEIVQNFETVKGRYARKNTLFLRYGNSLNIGHYDLLGELLVLQEEIGKERILIFPAYPNDRNSKIQLRNELANFNYRNIPVDSFFIPIYEDERKSYFGWMNNDGEIDMVFLPDKNKFQHTYKFFREVKRQLQLIDDEKNISTTQNGSDEEE